MAADRQGRERGGEDDSVRERLAALTEESCREVRIEVVCRARIEPELKAECEPRVAHRREDVGESAGDAQVVVEVAHDRTP